MAVGSDGDVVIALVGIILEGMGMRVSIYPRPGVLTRYSAPGLIEEA